MDSERIATTNADNQTALNASIARFTELIPSRAMFNTTTFDETVVMMKDPPVVEAAFKLLSDLIGEDARVHPTLPATVVRERMFLAGYMLCCYPDKVFGTRQEREANVTAAGDAMFDALDTVLQQARDVSVPALRAFVDKYNTYLYHFQIWKRADVIRLTADIEHAMIALYQARAGTTEDSEMAREIESNIERLRLKYISIASEAKWLDFQNRIAELSRTAYGTQVATVQPASMRLTNEEVAHELFLDPLFQFVASNTHIQRCFTTQYWESLVTDMNQSPPYFSRVIRVLGEIRDGAVDMCEGYGARINAMLDTDFINDQIARGLFTWESCRDIATSLVSIFSETSRTTERVDAAYRVQRSYVAADIDAAWAEVLRASDTVTQSRSQATSNVLRFVLDSLNKLRIDAANRRLRMFASRSIIQHHGAQYEDTKFREKLAAGTCTLDNTTAWLRASVSDPLTNLPLLVDGNAGAYVNVVNRALVRLVVAGPNTATMPETLRFDVHRIEQFHKELNYLVLAASAVATLRQLAESETTLTALKTIADKLARVVSPLSSADEVVETASSVIYQINTLTASDKATLVDRMRIGCTAVHNPVATLARERIVAFWVAMLDNNTAAAANVKLNYFYGLKTRIADSVQPLRHMAAKNREVHATRYNGIIAAIVSATPAAPATQD